MTSGLAVWLLLNKSCTSYSLIHYLLSYLSVVIIVPQKSVSFISCVLWRIHAIDPKWICNIRNKLFDRSLRYLNHFLSQYNLAIQIDKIVARNEVLMKKTLNAMSLILVLGNRHQGHFCRSLERWQSILFCTKH